MAQAFVKAETLAQPEYSIYIYHLPENQHEGQNDWEMRSIARDLNSALEEARALYKSRGYRKVEVKQRLVDPKTSLMHDYTLKIFAYEKDRLPFGIWLAGSVVLFFSVMTAWFIFSLF